MSTLPTCTTKNTILDADLLERAKAGLLIKLVVVPVPGERICYMAAYFSDEPRRPIYLATRRHRKEPKLFVDQTRLMTNLWRDFVGIPIDIKPQELDTDGLPLV